LQKDNFGAVLKKNAVEWKDSFYVVTGEDDKPIGFFGYNINTAENYGFLKFVILDSALRGYGIGAEMVDFICKFALEMTGVKSIRLNVFDVNKAAMRCYEKAGFLVENMEKDAFSFHDELWGRCGMEMKKAGL